MSYKVEWENDLTSPKTPLEAAKEAYEEIKTGNSLAFTVTDHSTGKRYSVELNEEEGQEVVQISE